MQEVTVSLQFITPCLAGVRRDDYDRFDRDASGSIVFLQSWWHELLKYGARAFGRHQNTILQTRMHPNVTGEVRRYRRYWGPNQSKEHEAFLVGDVIEVKAMLPDGLPEADFKAILKLAGGYRGISPYKWQDGFGRFTVVEKEKHVI